MLYLCRLRCNYLVINVVQQVLYTRWSEVCTEGMESWDEDGMLDQKTGALEAVVVMLATAYERALLGCFKMD